MIATKIMRLVQTKDIPAHERQKQFKKLRLGFSEERTSCGLADLPRDAETGYLSTMLIRREAHQPRHQMPTRLIGETLSEATG